MLNKIQNKQGFSLVELMVAIFVFSVIMTAVVGVFARTASSFKRAKDIQKNLEDAQYAMNLMAKTIRTSSIVKCDEDICVSTGETYASIRIMDYSQDKCIGYQVAANKLQSSISSVTHDADDIANGVTTVAKDWCSELVSADFSAFSDMASGYIASGNFYVIPSASGTAGRVTISMEVCAASDCAETEKDKARIQTTVSLRNYKEAGL